MRLADRADRHAMTIVLAAAAVLAAVNVAFLLGACRAAADSDRNLRAVFAGAAGLGGEVRALPQRRVGSPTPERAAG
jgi:hypothetical protein